jgi:beta-glucanase (GH16 family)
MCACIGARFVLADTELNIPGQRLVWHDEFEGTVVDAARWEVNVGVNAFYQRQSDGRFVEPHWFGDAFEPWLQVGSINDERQYYTPANVAVVDGVLEIRADRETVAVGDRVGWYDPAYHPYTSGKLNTADEFQFRYGIVKWRAQLPEGQGLWPALWLLNAPDPWFWDDEIDVMEAKGSKPTHMSSAHHFKVPDGGGNLVNIFNTVELDTGINLQTRFNEYGLEWQPTFLRTWVNDQPVLFDDEAVPQGPMFLIMNAAVGGTFDGQPTLETVFPTYFKIDWARVWQPASTPGDLSNGGFESFQGAQWADWNTLDDGNLAVYAAAPLHGAHSVSISRRNGGAGGPEHGPNLFTDGTAGGWQAYLNQLDAEGDFISGGPEDPANIPATLGDDTAILPIHQTAPSPRANAVIFRQIGGSLAQGRSFTFSGVVSILEPFAADASAIAFIRIFNTDFTFTDVATPVTAGGAFQLEAVIPESGVPFVQMGLETAGATGSSGRLQVAQLYIGEEGAEPPASDNRTGFAQTVVIAPGQELRYGVLAANHPADPIGPGAQARLRLEFLDAGEAFLSEITTPIVDSASGTQTTAYRLGATAPANAAFARLWIERVTRDPAADSGGGFVADAAFLHVPASTELPVVTAGPPPVLTVNAGDSVNILLQVASASPVSVVWYRDGVAIPKREGGLFIPNPDSGGNYYAVVENAAGPVVGATLALTVLDPDTDGDGISDYDESFITLTDPLDPLSTLRIAEFALSGSQVSLSFASVPGVSYRIAGSPDLLSWQVVGPAHSATTEATTLIEALPAGGDPLRFFRIEVVH